MGDLCMNLEKQHVDAVITWVDGSDPRHFLMRKCFLGERKSKGIKYLQSGRSEARFKNNNEIEYCVKSIVKFMPWIRHIFIVTDQQVPGFLEMSGSKYKNVFVIDHSEIFDGLDWALPTFNSRTIETMVHRIPGLADRYLYFNDDFFVLQKARIDDFFIGEKVVLRGRWRCSWRLNEIKTFILGVIYKALSLSSNRDRSGHLIPQMRAADLAGFSSRYFETSHAPHPVRTNTLKIFFDQNERILHDNIKHKFRSLDQFVVHPLAHHLEIASNNFVVNNIEDNLLINFRYTPHAFDISYPSIGDNVKFLCLQSLECASSLTRSKVLEFIDSRLAHS